MYTGRVLMIEPTTQTAFGYNLLSISSHSTTAHFSSGGRSQGISAPPDVPGLPSGPSRSGSLQVRWAGSPSMYTRRLSPSYVPAMWRHRPLLTLSRVTKDVLVAFGPVTVMVKAPESPLAPLWNI